MPGQGSRGGVHHCGMDAVGRLCAALRPLHLWDFFRPDPIFPPPFGAGSRVPVQSGLIWLGLRVGRASARRRPAAAQQEGA